VSLGRTGPGVCYRLYSEEEFDTMAPYTTPEILRVPLDSLLLQMVAMGLPDARRFPFIEAPPAESIEQSITTLKEQVFSEVKILSILVRNQSLGSVDGGRALNSDGKNAVLFASGHFHWKNAGSRVHVSPGRAYSVIGRSPERSKSFHEQSLQRSRL